jgi:alpha-ketoglutarate-dependent taurine dioxygenase
MTSAAGSEQGSVVDPRGTRPVTEALAPLRHCGMAGLAHLIERLDASVWFYDRWLTGGAAADGPVVVFEGAASSPDVPSSRRCLFVERGVDVVECIETTDPLVVARTVEATGIGDFAGRRLRMQSAGRVSTGQPLAMLRSIPVVAQEGDHVRLSGTGLLGDGLVAAEDNALLVVFALTGSFDETLRKMLHGFRVAESAHRTPPVLAVDGEGWDFADVPGAPVDGDASVDLSGEMFGRAVRRNVRRLPSVAFDTLLEFGDEGNSAGALLLRGFPTGVLPPTPPTPTTPFVKDFRSEMTLLTVGRLLGQPVGYLPENNGNVVQNIVPTREGADRQVSTSSAVNLAWHTEAAFHPHRPRFLLLFCLRGDAAARTTLCSIREIVDALPLRTRALLAAPRFRTRADESYVRSANRPLGRLTPVLCGDPLRPNLVFDADLMVGQDPEAQAALRELGETMEQFHTSVVLEPGDLLVVDNTVAVHGRSPFTPRFDGTDRWLQRTFVVSDLSASAGERSGRVIRTRFTSPG